MTPPVSLAPLAFRHLLRFVQQRLQKPPSRLTFEEIDAPLIVAFLDDLR